MKEDLERTQKVVKVKFSSNNIQVPIDISTTGGSDSSTLDFQKYFSMLRTKKMGHVVLHSREITSTQEEYKRFIIFFTL